MAEQNFPYFFKKNRENGRNPIIAFAALEEWRREIDYFKQAMTFGASYPNIKTKTPPQDYSGTLAVNDSVLGDLVFKWRCWKAFTRKFINSEGQLQETPWTTPTFFLEVSENNAGDDNYLSQIQGYYDQHNDAIKCAIIGVCEDAQASAVTPGVGI